MSFWLLALFFLLKMSWEVKSRLCRQNYYNSVLSVKLKKIPNDDANCEREFVNHILAYFKKKHFLRLLFYYYYRQPNEFCWYKTTPLHLNDAPFCLCSSPPPPQYILHHFCPPWVAALCDMYYDEKNPPLFAHHPHYFILIYDVSRNHSLKQRVEASIDWPSRQYYGHGGGGGRVVFQASGA